MPVHPPQTLDPEVAIWIANGVLVLAYVFIALEKIPKVVIALLGASAVLLTGILTQEEAFAAIDFNVIFLLVGMMILVNILSQTGALKALALYAAKAVNASGVRLMLALALLTAILSAFLDNVTTVILIGTVTCSLAHQLRINPVPFLICETIASNIGGAATLIGDPPNIMVGSAANFSFMDFLIHLAPVIILIIPVALLTLTVVFREDLKLPFSAMRQMKRITTEGAITDRNLMIKALVVLGLVALGFVFHHQLGLEAATIALSGASLLMIFENSNDIWDDVEWTTVFFFIGLFIIVGAVEKTGTIEILADHFFELTRGDFAITTMALLWMSGVLSAVVDNIPYTATMIPLVQEMDRFYENLDPLWWSLALGACLGGNGTMIGATANVLVADMAHRYGHPIYFMQFLKIGGLIMIESLAISTLYLWLRYL